MPRSFGRYELVHPLGKGGMSEVYLARLTGAAGFEKFCIIKTILPQMSEDPQFVQRFQHEARVLVQLTHANIAQIYDMGQESQQFYMAIEYVPGVDLGRLIDKARAQDDRVPLAVALFIGQKLLEALGYSHRKVGADGSPLGVVHRDVSPQNVMVSYDGDVKVIDFGLAKSAASRKGTLPSMVMGKLGYMSPEQARGEPVDYRSDIFSAGLVLWELLAGTPAYQGQTVGEMVAQMSNPAIPPVRSARPELPEALEKVLQRALATRREDRFARADEMARQLGELIVREGHATGSEEVGVYVRLLCPDEYANQRKLISGLTHRDQVEDPLPVPGKVSTLPLLLEHDSVVGSHDTLVRSSGPHQARVSGEVPSPVPGPRLNRPLLVGVGVLALTAVAGGSAFVLASPKRAPAPPVVAPVAAAPPVSAPVKPKPKAKAPEDSAAVPQGRVPSIHAYEVFLDRGEFYAHAGMAQGFARGSAVQVLGPEDPDKTRAFWGEGIVMEVSDTLIRFQVEPLVKNAPGPLYVAVLKTTPPAEHARSRRSSRSRSTPSDE